MLRGAANIAIGAVLALMLAFASQFVLLPIVGTAGLGALRVIAAVVFWSVFLYVIVVVVRGRR